MRDNAILQQIGKRLVAARKRSGFTQEQLAEASGLSIKMISAAENGHKAMRPENIIKICECLSVSTDYLLKGDTSNLNTIAGADKIDTLSPKQKEVLLNIIREFLSAFDE